MSISSLLEYNPPQWTYLEENELYYPGASDSDSTDELLSSAPSESPPSDMAISLPVDSMDYGTATLDFEPPYIEDACFPPSTIPSSTAQVRHSQSTRDIGQNGNAATSQQQVQEYYHPYYRRHLLDGLAPPAPHSDYRHSPVNTRHRGTLRSGDRLRPDADLTWDSSSSLPVPAQDTSPLNFSDVAGDYIREQLLIPQGAPVDLWCAPEPTDGSRPRINLTTIMMLAIYGSDTKMLTLQGIYKAIIARFQWYNEHREDTSWKNTIRHSLSLHRQFVKVCRGSFDPGRGMYWMLDLSNGEGLARPRKRRRRSQPGIPSSPLPYPPRMLPCTSPMSGAATVGHTRDRNHQTVQTPAVSYSRSGIAPLNDDTLTSLDFGPLDLALHDAHFPTASQARFTPAETCVSRRLRSRTSSLSDTSSTPAALMTSYPIHKASMKDGRRTSA
ncbi:hypothetical protein B0H15DRAFT_187566 [Mycena belliarum]|uniref:Fork-head domain-containing protein n=1 Tax=Mycena belliarum TaxID=1033014 RepID=A0AAD6TMN3_9AGAR|nr:hypothetical protein B0H15DRAFT_187566 [Mycena belliae]